MDSTLAIQKDRTCGQIRIVLRLGGLNDRMQTLTLKSFYGTVSEGAAYLREYQRANPDMAGAISADVTFRFTIGRDD
jgi:hypothetical protein